MIETFLEPRFAEILPLTAVLFAAIFFYFLVEELLDVFWLHYYNEKTIVCYMSRIAEEAPLTKPSNFSFYQKERRGRGMERGGSNQSWRAGSFVEGTCRSALNLQQTTGAVSICSV